MKIFLKYFAYCGCAAGGLSFFLFVILPAIIYGVFPQWATPVENFMASVADAIHLKTIIHYGATPLLVFLIVGVPLIAFSPLWLGYFRDRRNIARLKQVGVKGTATIVAIEDTGITVNNNPQVNITLEIDGLDAKVQMSSLVGRVSFPRAGEKIEIVYDPSDPKIIMPASRMSK